MNFGSRDDSNDDEVYYLEDGRTRVLRGTIVGETKDAVLLQRRDGSWEIRKSIIVRVRRHDIRRSGP